MSVIRSKLNTGSPEFKASAAAMRARLEALDERLAQARNGGGAAARQRHVARGKLLPRERVCGLLDQGTSFFELSPLAAWNVYDETVPAAGLITGIGTVSGER
jgi:3-methylcrotonyl-CoA carboxylase beta subunit